MKLVCVSCFIGRWFFCSKGTVVTVDRRSFIFNFSINKSPLNLDFIDMEGLIVKSLVFEISCNSISGFMSERISGSDFVWRLII